MIRHRIELRESHLAAMRGQSALDRLGGQVAERWDEMSAEDRRLIVLSLVTGIEVSRARVQGSNRFDPSRLHFSWRYGQLARLARDTEGVDLRAEGVLTGVFDDSGNQLD